ncbi:polysaccharide biosynthesis C-terminal domain-containing protein [Kribbella sp. NPDC050470]|uniref:polysaccharide biosynthesis C-terminal domain-containing protein n=1 Tax=unclassified Kribbella TaxID=2644121 RepID=UPI00378B0483
MVVNVVGDLTLGLRYGITGLAASTTLSLLLAAAANTWLLRHRHDGVSLRPATFLLLRSMALAVVAAGAGLAVRVLLTPHAVIESACVAVTVCAVYGAGLLVTKAPEGRLLLDTVKRLRGRVRQAA